MLHISVIIQPGAEKNIFTLKATIVTVFTSATDTTTLFCYNLCWFLQLILLAVYKSIHEFRLLTRSFLELQELRLPPTQVSGATLT